MTWVLLVWVFFVFFGFFFCVLFWFSLRFFSGFKICWHLPPLHFATLLIFAVHADPSKQIPSNWLLKGSHPSSICANCAAVVRPACLFSREKEKASSEAIRCRLSWRKEIGPITLLCWLSWLQVLEGPLGYSRSAQPLYKAKPIKALKWESTTRGSGYAWMANYWQFQ